jgi:hypothetical protein
MIALLLEVPENVSTLWVSRRPEGTTNYEQTVQSYGWSSAICHGYFGATGSMIEFKTTLDSNASFRSNGRTTEEASCLRFCFVA